MLSKLFFFIFTLCLLSGNAYSFYRRPRLNFEVNIEPIFGFERVQKISPTAHTSDRLTYGARVTLGVPAISLEGEYLYGRDTENFSSTSITETDNRLKIGLRSGLNLGSFIRLNARAGMQITRNQFEQASDGTVTLTLINEALYAPYAGLGLKVNLLSMLAASGEFVAVMLDTADFSQNEYQATIGLIIKF